VISDLQKVNLRKLAKRWKHTYDEQGKPVESYMVVDRSAYYKLQRQLAAVGREVLEDFRYWQVVELGLTEENAKRTAALVWVALYSTGSNPIERVADDKLNWYYRVQLRSGLSRLVAWILADEDMAPEDKAWARELATAMAAVPLRKAKPKPKPRDPKATPLTEDDFAVLFEVVERRHKRHGFLRPWARPVIRLLLKAAPSISSELLYIERDTLVDALTDHEHGKTGAVPLWRRRKKARLVPVPLIEDEVRTLVNWPADWGTLVDLIAPLHKDRMNQATNRVRQEVRAVFEEAGIPHEGVRTYSAMRWGAIISTFKRTKDYVTVQQMFGVTIDRLKEISFLQLDESEGESEESSSSKSSS
jgi:hypothetical protein